MSCGEKKFLEGHSQQDRDALEQPGIQAPLLISKENGKFTLIVPGDNNLLKTEYFTLGHGLTVWLPGKWAGPEQRLSMLCTERIFTGKGAQNTLKCREAFMLHRHWLLLLLGSVPVVM